MEADFRYTNIFVATGPPPPSGIASTGHSALPWSGRAQARATGKPAAGAETAWVCRGVHSRWRRRWRCDAAFHLWGTSTVPPPPPRSDPSSRALVRAPGPTGAVGHT